MVKKINQLLYNKIKVQIVININPKFYENNIAYLIDVCVNLV